ncbi:SMEK domain-containing protein [Pseudoalteromonas sp. TAB23]|uniref:SMEK domain-containing protein n=1 Tax=Pseudoalteromonas sp. TAB23 TaxID=1938595 RepID=UPI0003F8D0A3|nr:SMEK domain-containing protein [Pseudoalteromonas sp. TAB23]
MTLDDRTEIIKKISRTLSIMMCDMKLHQSMNIFSIHINAEDFFCNVFNFLYQGKNFKNANSAGDNEAYIDLKDDTSKHVIQVTVTTSKDKIDNSLKILTKQSYFQYEFEIYYLLEKPKNLRSNTIQQYKDEYGIEDIRDNLKDFTDLLNDIKNLTDPRLKQIYDGFFKSIEEKYTDEISLQVVFEALIKDYKNKKIDYSEDFENVELTDKIKLNNLNEKVSAELHRGSSAAIPIYELPNTDALTDLKELIVFDFYPPILKSALSLAGVHNRSLANKSVSELHILVNDFDVCFNKVLGELCHRIESETFKADYQATSMAWVIIAFFFEECDIGVKE